MVVHRGGRGATMEYELVYASEGGGGERFIVGLGHAYDTNLSGAEGHLSGSNRAHFGAESGGFRGPPSEQIELKTSSLRENYANGAFPSHLGHASRLAVVGE